MSKLQKLRSSRSEEKIPSSQGNKGSRGGIKGSRATTYDFTSYNDKGSKDDDNDVLFGGILRRYM